MEKKKRGMAIVLTAILMLTMSGCSLFQDFDASGYVKAILDQNLKGDVTKAAELIEDTSEEKLTSQYEDGINTFVADTITSGVEIDADLEAEYVKICKSIFKDLKYEVEEAKKISKTEYDVDVTFQPSDIFIVFEEAVQADSEKLLTKAENGEYQGTEDEIMTQMQTEFVENAYTSLVNSYNSMKHGEKETYTFKVKQDSDEAFMIEDEAAADFMTKILSLDKIQD